MIPRARDAEAKVPIQIMVRPPPRPGSLARRAALQRSFLSLFATSAILPAAIRTLPASAAKYTVVPSGTVAEKEARLSEVEKLFLENPDDPYVFGERAQLDYDLKQLRNNRDYARALSSDVAAGLRVFPTTFSVPVTDINLAVNFWRYAGTLSFSPVLLRRPIACKPACRAWARAKTISRPAFAH